MTPSASRLIVLGQALIQHDLRPHFWLDFAVLAAMFGRADVCFADLETAIRGPLAELPTREGVFLRAADPVVLNCLRDLLVSLLATANNHIWDLGTGGSSAHLASWTGAASPTLGRAPTWPQRQRRPIVVPPMARWRWSQWRAARYAVAPPRLQHKPVSMSCTMAAKPGSCGVRNVRSV
jgi:hypothetical protein